MPADLTNVTDKAAPLISAPAVVWAATLIPILKDQIAYESDTGMFKVGDGVNLYSALSYSPTGGMNVSGNSAAMNTGTAVTVSSAKDVNFTENVTVYPGYSVRDVLVVYNTQYANPRQPYPVYYTGGQADLPIIYTEFFGMGVTPPTWFSISNTRTVGNLEVWTGVTTSGMAKNGSFPAETFDGDGIFCIITEPGTISQSMGATLTGGVASDTFSITVNSEGRLYLQAIEANGSEVITLTSSNLEFDTTYEAPYAGSTSPNPSYETGSLYEADVVPGTYSITASVSGTMTAPLYIGHVVTNTETTTGVVIDVPPTRMFNSAGQPVVADLLTLSTGPGIEYTGDNLFSGTVHNTGVLSIGTAAGSIALSSNLTVTNSTLDISGSFGSSLTNPMTTAGDLIIGGTSGTPERLGVGTTGQVLGVSNGAPAWLNAPNSGGINFGSLPAPTANQTFLVYPVGSSGLTLSAGLPGFAAYAVTAPTAAVTITLYKNGTSIGTINWAAAANAGTVTFASTVTFVSGDYLTASFQGTTDATFADFGVVLVPAGSDIGLEVAFGVYRATTQSIAAGTYTKILFDTVEYDNTSAFSITNSRFQPTVAGYYQLNAVVTSTTATTGIVITTIYKNGTEFKRGGQADSTVFGTSVNALVYLNGSTDYVEIFFYSANAISTDSSEVDVYFNGGLIGSSSGNTSNSLVKLYSATVTNGTSASYEIVGLPPGYDWILELTDVTTSGVTGNFFGQVGIGAGPTWIGGTAYSAVYPNGTGGFSSATGQPGWIGNGGNGGAISSAIAEFINPITASGVTLVNVVQDYALGAAWNKVALGGIATAVLFNLHATAWTGNVTVWGRKK